MTKQDRSNVVVVGSINMDLVVRSDHVPAPGETVLGSDFQTIPGGKGANQAVAVARLGARCTMIGRVGDDAFGARLGEGLRGEGIDTRFVTTTREEASGVAMIVVAASGENAICVASGANFMVAPTDVDAAEDMIASAEACVLQLELPVETVAHAIRLCRKYDVETILDPAPAVADPPDALFEADVVSPNESEAGILLAGEASSVSPRAIAETLHRRGAAHVVLKLGARGAAVFSDGRFEIVPGHEVEVVDTTAAGDAFTAALAVARARGHDWLDATRYANAAGALACTRFGAQPSMPTADAVRSLL